MLDQLTVADVLAATTIIFGVIISFFTLKDKIGWGKRDKEHDNRLASAEKEIVDLKREVVDIKKEQALDQKERRLIMKALLTIVPDGNPVKGELNQYLLER